MLGHMVQFVLSDALNTHNVRSVDITFTFVSKALWYRTFKKTRLLPDLKLLQNVPQHILFKVCKFHEKVNGQFFARGQNVLYNAQVLRL